MTWETGCGGSRAGTFLVVIIVWFRGGFGPQSHLKVGDNPAEVRG
jgi:hypothetical protein